MSTSTKVTVKTTHDRISLNAKFSNGESVSFVLSRSGEKMSVKSFPTTGMTQELMGNVNAIFKLKNKSNAERFENAATIIGKHSTLLSLATNNVSFS